MWVITHLHTGNKIHLLSGRGYSVGRVGSDIVLIDDTSISRSHAYLQASNESLKLEDKGSKYGTYHNEQIESKQKLPKGDVIDLGEGDRIQFGALKNLWLISKTSINTMVSSLDAKDLIEIKSHLDQLGGNIISKWESRCTHLTMPEITITIKVLHALIEKIPIVSCRFWKDYLKNIQEKKEPPRPNNYLPKRSIQLSSAIREEYLGFNEKRKTLFAGKTFVFMNKKHFDMYSPIVIKAGGKCKDLRNNVSKTFLLKKNTIVVQYVPSTQSQGTQTINTISEYLETHSLRTIPEYEIGLAIVCCTIEKYCNPSFNAISNILPDSAMVSPNIGTMLAENTRSQKSEVHTLPSQFTDIPESSCSKNKIRSGKPIQSEVYDSEVVVIDSEVQSSMDSMSMVSESENKAKKSEKSEESARKEIESIQNIDFSEDEFSENLVLSSDLPSNEIFDFKKSSQTKRRPTTPIDNCSVIIKKPRTSTSMEDKSQDEDKIQETPIHCDPCYSKAIATKQNIQKEKTTLPGFLQKSQITSSQANVSHNQSTEKSSAPAKRGRIALITDNDSDDDDDIFNFGSSPKKCKPSQGNISDEDELFAFGNKSSKDEIDHVQEKANASLPMAHTHNASKKSFKAGDISSKIKVSPIKAEPDGWLSAMSILKIKSDDDVKEEKNLSDEDLKQKQWIDSLKEGFEVRVRKMNLVSKASSCSMSRDMSNTSLNSTKKNFKAFVKKQNYKTQTQIIPTFPIVVKPLC